MNLQLLFDEYEIKSLCTNEIFKAAKRLFQENVIRHFKVANGFITGQFVYHDHVYSMSCGKPKNKVSAFCECGHTDVFCEHLVTLCLHYLDQVSPQRQAIRPAEPVDDHFSLYNFTRSESLKNRLEIILDIKRSTNEYSFYFFDNQSNNILTESFYFLYSFDEILENEPCPEKQHFIKYYYSKFGEEFFYPQNYYKISTELNLHPELLNRFRIFNREKMAYKIISERLEMQLRFSQEDDLVRMNLLGIVPTISQPVDLQREYYAPARTPFVLHNNSLIYFRKPQLSPLILTFQRQERITLDIVKFQTFLKEKIPNLKEKGLDVQFGAGLLDLKKTVVKPEIYLKVKYYNNCLYFHLFFKYKKRKIMYSYPQPFLMIDPWKYCERDVDFEQTVLHHILSLGCHKRKHLLYASGDAQYKLLQYLHSKGKQAVFSTPRIMSLFHMQSERLKPFFTMIPMSESHKVKVRIMFRIKDKQVRDPLVAHYVEQNCQFVVLKEDKVYELDLYDLLQELLPFAKWTTKYTCDVELDLGSAINIYQIYPGYCDLRPEVASVFQLVDFKDSTTLSIPERLNQILHPYQQLGVNWLATLHRTKLSGILADDMGLGKTLQTLTLLLTLKLSGQLTKPTLVVMPTTLLFNWEKEVSRFTPELKALAYEGQTRKELLATLLNYDLIFCSYAIVRRDLAELKKIHWDYVILDEAQAVKNPKSKTSQSVRKLKSNYRLALSGTPVENRVGEIWSIFSFLIPGYLSSYESFRQRFEIPIQQHDKSASARLQRHIKPLILRRMKESIALELPPKVESYIYCDMSKEQDSMYRELLVHSRDVLEERINKFGIQKAQFHVLSVLTQLRQICCHPALLETMTGMKGESHKFDVLKEMVEQILAEGHKIVIFSQFVKMLKIIQKWLNETGVTHEILTGESQNRKDVIQRFNEDPAVPIILISLKAGGTGINLTAADYVFHYDPWWNPAVENQATDRVHRIGQTKPVFVYKMITKGTVEDKICDIQNDKRSIYKDIFDVDYSFFHYLEDNDVKRLLSYL